MLARRSARCLSPRVFAQFQEGSSLQAYLPVHTRGLHVGVIGCGVAGLQVVRALQAKGIRATAFDKAPDVGGLWRENYAGYGVQVPKQFYEFPDFPLRQVPWGGYATGPQVREYIKEYVEEFQLQRALQLSTAVEEVKPSSSGGWTFVTKTEAGEKREQRFDYAVVCTGMYSQVKNVPTGCSADSFHGEMIHSCDFLDAQKAEGKRVLVLGGGKSANDCALMCDRMGAASVTVLQRRAHWPTPRLLAGVLPFQYIFLSRFGTYLISAHTRSWPSSSLAMKLFEKLTKPLMRPIFAAVELLFSVQFRLFGRTASGHHAGSFSTLPFSPRFRPKEDVVKDYYNCPHILDTSFMKARRSGRIGLKHGEVSQCSGKQVELKDGSVVDADIVIMATGFKKDYSVFAKEIREKLGVEEDGLYLYRHMLPPSVPNLAFVGSEVSSNSNILTHGLQAEWLARRLSGVPTMDLQADKYTMLAEVERTKAWKRSWMPKSGARANLVLLHHTHYHDRLLKDMGEQPLRKWPNAMAEFFMPYQPSDYNGIVGQAAPLPEWSPAPQF